MQTRERAHCARSVFPFIKKIPPDENRHFDLANKNRVKEYIERNREIIMPHQYVDLSRLDEGNILIRPVRNSDIIDIIKSFKNKAPGMSSINKLILSQLPANAIERYSLISNLTFSMGYYPIPHKNSLIIFAPKQGKDPRYPENYRPINLLGVPGKILERIINGRFMHYCKTNNILSQHQFGFRKKKGTDTAIAIAYEKNSCKPEKQESLQHNM